MYTLDRYLIAQILRPLGIALLLALVILLVERTLKLLDVVLGASGVVQVLFEVIIFLLPHYLGLALPISLLFGVMLAFNKLGRDGEIDAMQAAGVSLFRQVRPAVMIALGVMVLATAVNGYLKPYARHAYQAVLYAVTTAAIQTVVRAGVFAEIGDLTLLVQGIKADGVTFDKVFIHEQKPDGELVVIGAHDGSLTRGVGDGPPLLRLFDGVRIASSDPGGDTGGAVDQSRLSVLTFREMRTRLGPDNALFFRQRGVDERELTLTELWQRRQTPPEGVRTSDMLAEFNNRLAHIATIPFLPLLGISLALGRQRSDRTVGVVIGLVTLFVFAQVMDFAKNLGEAGDVDPVLGIWTPWSLFVTGVTAMFFYRATHVPSWTTWWRGLALRVAPR